MRGADKEDRGSAAPGTRIKSKLPASARCSVCDRFMPDDLRRTAATLAGDLGFDDAWIAKCLDHSASKKQGVAVPSVTDKVYNHSTRMKEKRAIPDGVASELRRRPSGHRTASRRVTVQSCERASSAAPGSGRAPTMREKGRRNLCDLRCLGTSPVALAITSHTRHSIEDRTRRRGE
jgi:hypothetical protein